MSYHLRLGWPLQFSLSQQNGRRSSLGTRMTSLFRNFNLRKRRFTVLLILLLVLFIIFAIIPIHIPKPTPKTLTLHSTIYIPTATLQPILQSRIDQQGPSGLLGSLIRPSITSLTPQSDGLALTLSENPLQGGLPPLAEDTMLLTFDVLNSSTLQVSGQSMPGSLLSLNGPLAQIKIPQGQLNSIAPTPNCGDSALAVKMGLPISTDPGQKSSSLASPRIPTQAANAYVEVTSSSLAAQGRDLGSLSVSQFLTAQNFRLGIEHNEIIARSDISLWQTGIVIGSNTTHFQPLAENGNLVLHVKQNDFSTLFFAFPFNNYDQQIEHRLNNMIISSTAGLFTVTQAAIGPNTHIPCAASDSLLLTGTTGLLS